MGAVEDYILGNGALHDRFFAITDILAKLVSSAPRAVTLSQLEDATDRSAKELAKLCAALSRAGLLRQEDKAAGKWVLTCDPSFVTLEDVFRCALVLEQERKSIRKSSEKSGAAGRVPSDVDLLIMQAMIAVNQSVFMHLRQFSLDRLKISAAGMFPSVRRPRGDACLEDTFDLAISGNEGSFSPVQVSA